MKNSRTQSLTQCSAAPVKDRDSNIELLRILSMFFIIAHHYVMNLGFKSLFDLGNVTGNMIFLQIFGSLGTIGVNCFTLITGYFMIQSRYSLMKVLRLWLAVWFYRIALNLALYLLGFSELFTVKYLIKTAFGFVFNVNEGYVSSMLLMYLLIPFMNRMIQNLTRKMHLGLIALLIFVYSVIPTFAFRNTWHYVPWLCTVYLVGAYIRLYPCALFHNRKIALTGAIAAIGLIWASIPVIDALGVRFGFYDYYYMCYQSNKLLPFLGGVFLFLLFLNFWVGSVRSINRVAASTFGVVLIHGNSEIMRRYIWMDLFKNVNFYNSHWLALHAVGSILAVYAVCTLIDMARIRFVERPLMARLNAKEDVVAGWLSAQIDHFMDCRFLEPADAKREAGGQTAQL